MAMFRNNPAATVVQRIDTRVVLEVNDAFVEMVGHPREKLVGQTTPDFWEDPAQQLQFRAQLRASGRVDKTAARGTRANGDGFDCLLSA
jgi:PAS domain S-box-containing protein